MSADHSARSGGVIGHIFSIFYNIEVCCVFSLEFFIGAILMSTHNICHFQYKKKKVTLNYPKPAALGFFQGTQGHVRSNHGKRAISVRATEGVLYFLNNLSLSKQLHVGK